MQLGTRWAAGAEPPASVPAALRPAIADVEAQLAPAAGHWTLTWLEGRPIAELDAGWEVLLTASGEVVARPFQD
ncbi:hypothetical protein [Microbacterium sp.]|uniref:hypothetical protein n=1 Tax=Microbacterium sp. TaxID=51671 RepID=UPI002810F0FF|nr:hypothetical protein [Microbacterium sp.]